MFISITQPTIPKRMSDKGGWGPYALTLKSVYLKKHEKGKKKRILISVSHNSK